MKCLNFGIYKSSDSSLIKDTILTRRNNSLTWNGQAIKKNSKEVIQSRVVIVSILMWLSCLFKYHRRFLTEVIKIVIERKSCFQIASFIKVSDFMFDFKDVMKRYNSTVLFSENIFALYKRIML